MAIRIASLEDADRIVEVTREDGSGKPLSRKRVRARMAKGETYLLAEEGGEPAGVAKIARNDNGEPELFVISVKLKFQKRGIGSALLQKVEEIARRMGNRLVLHVLTNNVKALRFYRKHGFEVVGKVKDLYAPGERHYKMRKIIRDL